MTGIELVFLLIAWAVAGGSPGPATLSIAGTSMDTGRKAGLAVAAGIVSGSASWGIAAALGMGTLMMTNAWIFTSLKYFGAAYLLYLALKSLRSAFQERSLAANAGMQGGFKRLYLKGLLIHLTNPKAILSWGAIYAIALGPQAELRDIFNLFFALILTSTFVFFGYAFLFSTNSIVKVYYRARRWFELTFAALFGAASLKIFTLSGQ